MPSTTIISLSAIPAASSSSTADSYVAVRDNGSGSYTDYRVTGKQIAKNGSKVITIAVAGTTVSDSFIDSDITELVMNNLSYIADVDFTVSTNTITLLGGMLFYAGQKILVRV